MTFFRIQALPAILAASILAVTAGPLLAAQSHDVCDAMRHGCASINAVASCCCNGSDANASKVPSARADAASALHAVPAAVMAFALPTIAVAFVREGPPDLARPPDFCLLFSDLRL